MERMDIKKVVGHSRNIHFLGAVCAVLGLAASIFAVMALFHGIPSYIMLAAFPVAGAYAAFKRPSWGKTFLQIACIPLVFIPPFGTAAAILAFVAMSKSGDVLFGDSKRSHSSLVAELKAQK